MAVSLSQSTLSNQERRVLVWFDDTTAVSNDRVREISELQDIVDIVEIFDDANRCVDYINNIRQQNQVYLVVCEINGAQIVHKLDGAKLLRSIYVILSNPSVIPSWTRAYKNLKCILSGIQSIRYRLHMDTHDTLLGFDTIGPGSLSLTASNNNNKQEVMFMYGQLLKYIFIDMSDSDIDFNDMLRFLNEKYKDKPKQIAKINELERQYASKGAVWWYTTEPFLYSTLNDALRTYDIDNMCAMGVFIRDLHRNIVELRKSMKQTDLLKLYRGQVIPMVDFLKIKTNIGGLLSINNFLSTSSNADVALMFALDGSKNCQQASVLFEITIDPSKSTNVAYADIKKYSNNSGEDEYLFTMGSVFRIKLITEPDANGCWGVSLIMTEDHDPELLVLHNYMQSNLEQRDLHSLGLLLSSMGAWEKAIEICEKALKTCRDSSTTCQLNQVIGVAHYLLGNIEQSTKPIELGMDYEQQLDSTTPITWIPYISKAISLEIQGKFDLALENAQLSLKILLDCGSEGERPVFVAVYMMIGHILQQQGQFSEAMSYYQKAYDIAVKHLPPTEPVIGQCLEQIASVHFIEGRIDEGLHFQQKSVEIMQRSLPPTHVLQGNCQSTLALISRQKNIFAKSLMQTQCLHNPTNTVQNDQSGIKHSPMELVNQMKLYLVEDKVDEAISAAHECLRTLIEKCPSNHHEVAFAHMRLGMCLTKNEDWSEALRNFNKAYEIMEQNFTQPHIFKLIILLEIVKIYISQDNFDGAVISYQNWQIAQQNSGISCGFLSKEYESVHEFVALHYEGEGLLNTEDKKYDLAVKNYQESLQIRKAFLPSDQLKLAVIYQALADVFDSMGKVADALSQRQLAINVLNKHLSPTDSKIARNQKLAGLYCIKLQQYHNAMKYFEKCLHIEISSLSTDQSDVVDTYYLIAEVHFKNQQLFDALVNFQCALDICLKCLSPTDPKIATNYKSLGFVYHLLHRYEEALLSFENCLKIQLITLQPDHIDIADTYKLMASTATVNKKHEDALVYWQKCLEIQTKSLDPGHPDLAATYMSVGDAQMNRKNFSDALACYQYALDIQRECSPSTDSVVATIRNKLARAYSLLNPSDQTC
jgi:tetratricopeptide (TPR) repeat protein